MNWFNRYTDAVYCVVRLTIGLMFACHGGQKILGFPPSERGLATNLTGLTAGWIELSCGFMIALGFLTRLAAFIASGEMAVGYFLAHAPAGVFPIQNHGEPAVFYCFFFLFVVFYGSGRWSLDALLFNRASTAGTTPPAAT